MPAPDPAFVQQVTDWLRAKCPGHSCTACGAADWFAGEMAVPPTSAGGYVPLVPVICKQCGHATLFSAVVMGLASRPPS